VLRDYIGMPDLVVTGLVATANSVVVTIKNQGDSPAVDEFWIDFYVNPIPPPVKANDIWYDGRSAQGIVWAITNLRDPASQPLPLLPGQSYTVTFKDALVDDYYTGFAFPLTPGAPVYAHVDSVNLLTTYGGVLENHEARGGAYNNIFGPVYVAGEMEWGVGAAPRGRLDGPVQDLPLRPPR
jgi:hypothetical protein